MTRTRRVSTIAIVDYEGAQRAAVLGLQDLLEAANRLHGESGGRKTLAVEVYGMDALTRASQPLSAVVLPPSLSESPPQDLSPALSRWLRSRYSEGTMLCSVCVGAFILAELGVLDGRPATTHWALGETLAQRHPQVQVDTSRLIVDDGDVVTAGGLMAWVDLGLDLAARFLGPSTMLATARLFLVDPGGREQRFYATFSPEMTHGDEAILRVQRWLQRVLADEVCVDAMAAKARLGRRTFLRRFQKATGLKTSAYLQHLRVAKARELLERGDRTQEEIAWTVGYADPGAFRRVFIKLMGLSPAEYRRRFNTLA